MSEISTLDTDHVQSVKNCGRVNIFLTQANHPTDQPSTHPLTSKDPNSCFIKFNIIWQLGSDPIYKTCKEYYMYNVCTN